jgi:hypothetical protein
MCVCVCFQTYFKRNESLSVLQNQALVSYIVDTRQKEGTFSIEDVASFLDSLEKYGFEWIPTFLRTFSKKLQNNNK